MIWWHPRQAMRYVLNNFPRRHVHLLAILGTLTTVIGMTISFYNWWVTLIIWVSLAILGGLFYLYVIGGLLKWTGSWLKGQGTFEEIRAAIAWAQIPVIAFFIIQMIVLWLVKGNGGNPIYATVFFILCLWSSIIFLCCLAEAQQFSFFKALINYIIMAVIVIAVAVIVMIIVSTISPPSTAQTNLQTT